MSLVDNPWAFALVARVQNCRIKNRRWVTPQCDMVLEGYPRSANTYLFRILRAASGDRLKIAHHVHWAQQVVMAVRYDVPSFVLFRPPKGAVASRLVRMRETSAAALYLEQYIVFAESTLGIVETDGVHLLTFDEVIAEPVAVANDILAEIGRPAAVTHEMVARATVDDRADRIRSSQPNSEKEKRKASHLEAIAALPNYDHALALYHQLESFRWHR